MFEIFEKNYNLLNSGKRMHQKRTVNYCCDFVVNLMRKFQTTARIPSYNSSLNNSTLQSSVSMAFEGKQFEQIP